VLDVLHIKEIVLGGTDARVGERLHSCTVVISSEAYQLSSDGLSVRTSVG
jgi:hypothetical protein